MCFQKTQMIVRMLMKTFPNTISVYLYSCNLKKMIILEEIHGWLCRTPKIKPQWLQVNIFQVDSGTTVRSDLEERSDRLSSLWFSRTAGLGLNATLEEQFVLLWLLSWNGLYEKRPHLYVTLYIFIFFSLSFQRLLKWKW